MEISTQVKKILISKYFSVISLPENVRQAVDLLKALKWVLKNNKDFFLHIFIMFTFLPVLLYQLFNQLMIR